MDVTMITTVRNTLHAVSLMRESFLRHHDPVPWVACDDLSSDGAGDYLDAHADRVTHNRTHRQFGDCLDDLARSVATPYTLFADSDVEFLGPVLPEMRAALPDDALCVCTTYQAGESQLAGYTLRGQRKIDHSCALFHTARLQHILEHFSFTCYANLLRQEYYDGGAMVYRAACLLGLPVVEMPSIWSRVVHYGGLSALFVEAIPDDARAVYRHRYDVVRRRLETLREGRQPADGLTWGGETWNSDR